MRILLIHNHYIESGGEDIVYEAELDLLRKHGNTVEALSFTNDHLLQRLDLFTRARAVAGTLWSRQAADEVRSAQELIGCSVVHVHNTFPTASPSVYSAARTSGAAVVQTLHNYRVLCPNATFFRDGRVCEDCLGKFVPWPGVLHACYRDSRAASGVTATMLAVHRARRTWTREVDLFIALTDFSRRKFIEGGFPAKRIVVKPNFLADNPKPSIGGKGFLFVGRLDETKGLDTLIQAWRELPDISLNIVGNGPLYDRLSRDCATLPCVNLHGHKPHVVVLDQMRTHAALIFPSRWYETFGLAIIEAFATGLPVIASRLGAMQEIVDDGRTGLLFEPDDPVDLAAKVRWATDHPHEIGQMGANARAEYEAKYTAETNYRQLMAIYERAIEIRRTV